jgi:hypothetical protein
MRWFVWDGKRVGRSFYRRGSIQREVYEQLDRQRETGDYYLVADVDGKTVKNIAGRDMGL